ncbi:MAG: DNA mismatch endonuclease Vsr [Nitratireductor sp.]
MKTEEPAVSAARSRIMRGNRQKDTKPELVVRRCLHAMGYRFRLHRRDLPGNPDIVLPRHHTVIQVHGCFWHQHAGCKLANVPRTRRDYWIPKLAHNVERDAASAKALEALGWRVITIWECDVNDPAALRDRFRTLLPSNV